MMLMNLNIKNQLTVENECLTIELLSNVRCGLSIKNIEQ